MRRGIICSLVGMGDVFNERHQCWRLNCWFSWGWGRVTTNFRTDNNTRLRIENGLCYDILHSHCDESQYSNGKSNFPNLVSNCSKFLLKRSLIIFHVKLLSSLTSLGVNTYCTNNSNSFPILNKSLSKEEWVRVVCIIFLIDSIFFLFIGFTSLSRFITA